MVKGELVYGIYIGVACLSKRTGKNLIDMKNISESSAVAHYADSIIAVRNSCGRGYIKYLKRLKFRSVIKTSDVAVVQISEDSSLYFIIKNK